MKNRMTYRQNIAAAVGIALIASGLTGAATSEALADSPGNVSNEQLPQLTAQWTQWALSLPNDVNPVVDETGALCVVGQRGSVWFLAGTFFGSTVPIKRTCTVPEGTTLFFPVINGFAFNTPGCGQPDDLNTVKKLKQFYYPEVSQFVDQAYDLSATLNGHKLKTQRVESQPFAVTNPPGNIWGPDACGMGVPLEPGIYSPGIVDGYWATIENLKASPKPYTIYFHAQSGATVQDITYNLTVTPVYLK
jgi:hypothetical protein